MFAINIRRLYVISDRLIVRNLRNRGRRFESPTPNPGLDKRLRVFKEEGIKVQDNEAEEFIEQSESSFYNMGVTYNEHLNETLIGKHELKHHIVKEKYFKENMPNLLTWSEKEQIRHLATTQPEEWTPARIAESFPVTEPVAKKLLKYPWKPTTEQRIARHDASAMRNWRELKEGTLDIPEDLRQHLLKFSERTIPPLNKKSIKIELSQEEKMGEFEKIVRRCAANERKAENHTDESNSEDNTTANNKSNPVKDTYRVTLDQLANRIKKRVEKGKDVNFPDKIIMDSVSTSQLVKHTSEELSKEIELVSETKRNEDKALTEFKEKESNVSPVINYPERIRIPKKAYKRGATYKMNDCFYDHDGRFLYRVIGMNDNH